MDIINGLGLCMSNAFMTLEGYSGRPTRALTDPRGLKPSNSGVDILKVLILERERTLERVYNPSVDFAETISYTSASLCRIKGAD